MGSRGRSGATGQEAVGTWGPLLLSPNCRVWNCVALGFSSSCLTLRGLGSTPRFSSSVILGKFLNFSVPRFASVENGSNTSLPCCREE